MSPKELVLQIFNDVNRDCHYYEIIYKVAAAFPNMTEEESGECDEYAWDLHIAACTRFETEHVSFFDTDVRDFEMRCQQLVDDVCVNKFFRDEMYEHAVESDVFMERFYSRPGKRVDFGGEDFDGFDGDSDMTYSEQCHADRSDYASQFSDPIQRAEIRAGA